VIATEADVLVLYDKLGTIVRHYQSVLLKHVSAEAMHTAARRLGLLRQGVFVYSAESEMAVHADYCIYNMPVNGLNLAGRYLRDHPPVPGSDEETVLRAMAGARYALLSVSKLAPGVGVECYDLLRGQDIFMANRGFSLTGQKGAVLASRLLSLPGFDMSTGADLPVFAETMDAISEVLNEAQRRLGAGPDNVDDPSIAPELSTGIIRACLRCGASEYMRYDDSRAIEARAARGEPVLPSGSETPPIPDDLIPEYAGVSQGYGGPTSRNRPCPCGSGLKYKRCCGSLKHY
jgi:hypothetical protein